MLTRIPDSILETVFYLYPAPEDASEGVNVGGSGFLMSYPLPKLGNRQIVYGVTNAHVIDEDCRTIRLNTADGGTHIEELAPNRWVKHPNGDDVAVCVVPVNSSHKYRCIGQDFMLTQEKVDELNIGPGDTAFIVGRFINHEGRQRNLPSVRSGIVSQLPWEKVRQRRQNAKGYFDQESFLVEVKSIGGFSGSPVFVSLDVNLTRVGRPGLDIGTNDAVWLLGVDWGHILDWSPVCDASGRPNNYGQQVQINTGMMGVVPAWKLKELLDCDELKEHRAAIEEAVLSKKNITTAALDSSAPKKKLDSTSDENPNAREDFTRLANAAARTRKQDE